MADPCKTLWRPNADQLSIMGAHLPIGGIFLAAHTTGTNLNRLILGLIEEFLRMEVFMQRVCMELDPNQTVDLIEEWERSVGIPNDCFKTDETLETRRAQVLLLLSGLVVQTEQDFIDLAIFFGVDVIIEQGSIRGAYPHCYPALYLGGAKAARNTIIVHFPDIPGRYYPHPYDGVDNLYGSNASIVECIFNKVKPATTRIIYSYGTTPPDC